ncbi:MAG: hypothetical protein QOG43_2781 [Actinomycetota bacterium]|jgi:hypothetical protein|nr:hypothetical protein [Actinomycetota bacterium]
MSQEDGVERLTRENPPTELTLDTDLVSRWRVDDKWTYEGAAAFDPSNATSVWRLDLNGDNTFSFGGGHYWRDLSGRRNRTEILLAVARMCPAGLAIGITCSDTLDDTHEDRVWELRGDERRLGESFSEGPWMLASAVYVRDDEGNGGSSIYVKYHERDENGKLWLWDDEREGGPSYGGMLVADFVLPSPAEAIDQLVQRLAANNYWEIDRLITLHGTPHHFDGLEQPASRRTTSDPDLAGIDQPIERHTPAPPVDGLEQPIERLRPPSD